MRKIFLPLLCAFLLGGCTTYGIGPSNIFLENKELAQLKGRHILDMEKYSGGMILENPSEYFLFSKIGGYKEYGSDGIRWHLSVQKPALNQLKYHRYFLSRRKYESCQDEYRRREVARQ